MRTQPACRCRASARPWLLLAASLALAGAGTPLAAQGSQAALDVTAPAARVAFPLDDDAPGDQSSIADVGAGDFTVELWLRGTAAGNPTASAGGDVELAGHAWRDGNVVVDRSAVGTDRAFGVSVAGGFVRFGTGGGDGPGAEAAHTLEGDVDVLDGAWHHVACVRVASSGTKLVFVDGALDVASAPGVSTSDLSYPDDGVAGAPAENPELFLGAPKGADPDFAGLVDELRLWARAADEEDVLSWHDRVVYPLQPGLAADWRLEEGSGTSVADRSQAGAPDGALAGGPAWRSAFATPADVAPISHGLLPFGFHRELVATGFVEATVMQALPGGDLLVAERGGRVLRLDPSTDPAAAEEVLQITTSLETVEYGLLGIALDPSFATNGWIYLHHTSQIPTDRVSRFTLPSGGGPVDPASEVVIWENDALGPGHTGGAISFGPDGKLYIPTGDAFDPLSSQDLSHQNGKVLRINPDGTLPPDNPGASIPGAHPAIWAWGLRNPFRSGWDPLTGVLWIADVGGEIASSWEEVHHGAAGANYGWPTMQGPDCYVPPCAGMTPAFYGYRHDDPDLAPGLSSAAIIGGLVMRGTTFPAAYEGDYVFADYATGWMRRLRLDAGGALIDAPLFMPVFTAGTVVDFAVEAGDLLYLTVGLPWSGGDDDASLHRVRYVADDLGPESVVVLDTSPSGLALYLDGYPVRTPFTLRTQPGRKHTVGAPFFQQLSSSGATVSWSCWSDGAEANHGFVAPSGGANLTAVYTSGGAACETGHGFSTYGHGAGGANVLGLVGGGGAAPGAVLTTQVTGLSSAPGTGCWIGLALGDWSFPLLGGTILIDSFSQFATAALSPDGGAALWQAPVPAQPGLAGATFYGQAIATDASLPFGLAFSNGLKVVLAP
jgi:glucose/arabinose dehydrogenase